jgi:16S rRNA G966 N2-methylase RsmD
VDHQAKACELIKENLRRTKFTQQGTVVRGDYLEYLRRTKEKFDIILLDPPYAEIFLENALNCIAEIDILRDNGIIVTERPLEKALGVQMPGFTRSRDYKYGKTLVTLYRRDDEGDEA